MQLFPDRDERSRPWLLPAAVAISLLLHLLAGGAFALFGHQIANVVAKVLPRPTPTPEIVALSDAITIEKRTVPRESHRSVARPPQRRALPHRRAQPRPRVVAQVPRPRTLPVPTLAPLPTSAPTVVPTYRPVHATIHHPRAEPTTPPPPRRIAYAAPTPVPATRNRLSSQQVSSMEQQFRRTIASANRQLFEVPRQRRPPAIAPNAQRYAAIMAGTPQQFLTAQGDCVSLQDDGRSPVIARVLRCLIRYSDGYYEEVTFPWTFRFLRRTDPFAYSDQMDHPFPMQPPPPGFTLPQPFALSRAVCSFYRAQCEALIERESAAGNQPAPPR